MRQLRKENEVVQATGTQSYLDILNMDPLVFLTYLEQFKKDVAFNVDDPEDMRRAGRCLGDLANAYSLLSSLYSCAGMRKRQLSRGGQTSDYQDMIDKEAAVERAMKSCDMQYRAISKMISLHIENNKELYFTDGIRARDR